MLYTVDATVATGLLPVAIIAKTVSTSPTYGHLWEAPYQVNDTVSHAAGTASITLKVLQKLNSSYSIRIDYQRQ